jgi:translation initiation factor IF-3
MNGAEYHIEDLKRREEKKEAKKVQTVKGEKLLSLSSKITEHDLNAKLAMTLKWLHKLYEVRVVISNDGSESQKAEHIAATLEQNTIDVGKILQKRVKDGTVRFQIMPIIKKDEKLLDASNNDPQKQQSAKAMHTDARRSGSS